MATAFLHLAQQLSTATPPARAVARHVALQHRLLALMGPLCSGRPTLAHTASFCASSRACSRHPLSVAHEPLQSCACPFTRACSRCCYSTRAPKPLRSSTAREPLLCHHRARLLPHPRAWPLHAPLLIPGCSPPPGSRTCCARTRPNTCRLLGSRAPLPRQRSRALAPATAPAVPPLCLLPRSPRPPTRRSAAAWPASARARAARSAPPYAAWALAAQRPAAARA
jgi:hypothetical protein